jgi:outer membrane protein OmpA-like peptidoglycan-associated protein
MAAADCLGFIQTVQAQPEEDKKKKERPRQRPETRPAPPKETPKAKGAPPKTFQQHAPQAPPGKAPPPALKAAPQPQKMPPAGGQPSSTQKSGPATKFHEQPQVEKSEKKSAPPGKPGETKSDPEKGKFRRAAPPRDQGTTSPGEASKSPPVQIETQKGTSPLRPNGPKGQVPPAAKSQKTFGTAVPGPRRFEDVRKERRERVEDGGRRRVIQEPGNRTIVKEGTRAIIRHDEAERFSRRPGARSERRNDGSVETYYVRPDGVRIVTVVDGRGRLIRRYRLYRDGRERNIIDNRRFYRNVGIGVGIGIVGGIIALNLPPPRITIPRDRYIVDYERASDDDLYETLEAPPVEELDRAYSLEEIRDNYELRARVRRIDLDTVNFEFGAWEVGPDQYHKLERIARAILRLLERNPEAVIMIEGHTDAVGSEDDNLSLADRRASAVAEILTDQFDVPPENLITQGYGEQYLKVDTQGPERLNRRVTVLNITRLMAER